MSRVGKCLDDVEVLRRVERLEERVGGGKVLEVDEDAEAETDAEVQEDCGPVEVWGCDAPPAPCLLYTSPSPRDS